MGVVVIAKRSVAVQLDDAAQAMLMSLRPRPEEAPEQSGFPGALGAGIARASARRVSGSVEIRFAKENIHERRHRGISSRDGGSAS